MAQDKRTIINDYQIAHYSNANKNNRTVSIPRFNWVPDKLDKRDFIYKYDPKKLPTTVDLRSYATKVEDQGNLGSCTGNAIACCIELLNRKNKNKTNDISRLFIYYYERLMIGTVNYDSGAYIRDGIKVTNKYGAPLETLWPYDIKRFRVRPDSRAVNDALKRRVLRYERIRDFQGCKDALAKGYPVVIGFYVFSSFMTKEVRTTGMMPYPDSRKESLLGGHAVLLVGYNDDTQRFIVKNSWGNKWGDNGYFYMPYDVIRNSRMSDDFWIIQDVNSP